MQKFRYSNVQRVKETKSKHYSKIIEKIKKNEHIRACAHRIGNTVERLQREKLFFRNDNGLHKNKNEVNGKVYTHYRKELYRKLKWYGFINRQRSEDKMMNCFQKKFGKAENTIVCIGDWEPRKRIETYEILTTN